MTSILPTGNNQDLTPMTTSIASELSSRHTGPGCDRNTLLRDCMRDPSPWRPGEYDRPSGFRGVMDQLQEMVTKLTSLVQNLVDSFTSLAQSLVPATPQLPAETPPAAEAPVAPTPTVEAPANPEISEDCGTKETPASKEAKKLPKTGEFLWKPVSDKDGKLAILLPGKYTGKVKSVSIVDPKTGKRIEKGSSSGTGNPVSGKDREHFRFNKPGGSYPDGAVVSIKLENGNTIEFKIRNTSARTEH